MKLVEVENNPIQIQKYACVKDMKNIMSDPIQLLFRIEYADVTAVPGVTQKASPSTKAEFDELISGTGVDEAELQREREKTNR